MRCVRMSHVAYLRMNMHTAHKIPPAPAANPTTPIITYTTMESTRKTYVPLSCLFRLFSGHQLNDTNQRSSLILSNMAAWPQVKQRLCEKFPHTFYDYTSYKAIISIFQGHLTGEWMKSARSSVYIFHALQFWAWVISNYTKDKWWIHYYTKKIVTQVNF